MDNITLREYLLAGFDGDEKEIFYTDEEMIEAESWDAEVFVEAAFHKKLGEVPKESVFTVFKALSRKSKFCHDIDTPLVNGNNLLLEGGSKKLNLLYNENFELTYLEEEN